MFFIDELRMLEFSDISIPVNHAAPMNRYITQTSSIHGKGLFASEFLPKGTIWWRTNTDEVIFVSKAQYDALRSLGDGNSVVLADIQTYAYYVQSLDRLVYLCTDARHLNHSHEPNCTPTDDRFGSVTLRDIEAGEELFEDYSKYDVCPWANLWGELGKNLGSWKL